MKMMLEKRANALIAIVQILKRNNYPKEYLIKTADGILSNIKDFFTNPKTIDIAKTMLTTGTVGAVLGGASSFLSEDESLKTPKYKRVLKDALTWGLVGAGLGGSYKILQHTSPSSIGAPYSSLTQELSDQRSDLKNIYKEYLSKIVQKGHVDLSLPSYRSLIEKIDNAFANKQHPNPIERLLEELRIKYVDR